MTMDALSANDAKPHFGDLLLKAQRAPVQINKTGKYESIEALKFRFLQSRVAQANDDIATGELVDGEAFFSELGIGQYD